MSYDPQKLSPEEKQRRRRRNRLLLLALGVIVAILLAIIASQQLWLWTIVSPNTASDAMVLYALSTLNFVAFVVFSFIFVRNILKLRREREERQLGSKIKTRLLVYFISISFLPITAMAVFSYLFLNRSLEKWFYPFPEVVQQANEVRRQAVDRQLRNLHDTASLLVMFLNKQSAEERQATLDQTISSGQFAAVEIVSNDGAVQLHRSSNLAKADLARLEALFVQARKQSAPSGDRLADGRDFDVVSVPLNDSQKLIIAPQRSVENDLDGLIQEAQQPYQDLVRKQRQVRLVGISTLGLMTLILLFVSSWVAIYLARGIATPIKALAEASNEVARGNLHHRVATIADDELALLAQSFNQMTTQLEENRTRIEAGANELRETNLALLERRNYIETVLESLSTGVVSVDEADRITTLNASASRMLGSAKTESGRQLNELIGTDDWAVVDRLLKRARRTGHATEQTQLVGGGNGDGSLPVAMTATALRNFGGPGQGVVLVIEDLSELLSAQRAAAWSEVARRMAHEIKNPLTPIQLSAERIAKNYKRVATNGGSNGNILVDHSLDEERVGAIIAECTETISREVAGLKAMVDEFSRFARLPPIRLESANLNDVIGQAVALYEERVDGVVISLNLAPELPASMLDVEQNKRVFVNLIDNALDAVSHVDEPRQISITTRHDFDRSVLVAEIADTGRGIETGDFKRLFQPYFSRRESGTGLGLAIVQRIILEHKGKIRAERNSPRGAKFVIELPTT
jgi:PAS domain S-box-containing protein